MIPTGETRVSMPYFLLPKMDGDLVPFGKSAAANTGVGGYEAGRDRGANAAADLMRTFSGVTRRWWAKEFAQLEDRLHKEEQAETNAAFKLAAQRAERFKEATDK